jgi:hypothetical protein
MVANATKGPGDGERAIKRSSGFISLPSYCQQCYHTKKGPKHVPVLTLIYLADGA